MMKELTKRRLGTQAVVMLTLVSVLSACSSSSGSSEVKTSKETEASTKKPVTIKVEVFDRGNSPTGKSVTNNYLTKYVEENFTKKTNIKVEYVPVPRSQEVEKLNVLMASGDAPDIVFTYDSNVIYKYVQQGGVAEIGALLDQYGSNLKTYLGKDTLAYGTYDGKQYAIPGKRVYLGKYSSEIRQDWLDKLGLPVPKTTDEVYQTLKAFKEKKPGGEQTIPLGFSLTNASYEPIIWSFIKKVSEEERYTLTQQLGSSEYTLLLPGHKDGVRFLNKLYSEGMISPDFALDKDKKKMYQDVATGKVGMYAEDAGESYLTSPPDTYTVLQKTVAGAKLAPIDPYTSVEGKHPKPAYIPAALNIIIPKTSKVAAEAVKYLDWMAQKDVLYAMTYGVEGKNFSTTNGLPVPLDNEETKQSFYNKGDYTIITNGTDFGSSDKNTEALSLAFVEANRKDATQAYKNGMADGLSPVRFQRPIEAEGKYGKALQDKYEQLIVKSILAKPADFDKTYDDMLKDYMTNGGEAIQKERTEAYKNIKK
ncbi:putative aldouronate transport system substrate-binding protein [Paenibacillus sp. V4I3]|uniref:extracellular solute-binding protein n=1 Tax=unclassified Paenibacillus TaxID=185978 RepID=UPI00277EB0E3|nr:MULTISPECIES: extracellular solute-binding protein [unclassified Paenibacillus]MDQ0873373.1 putative aldouronate transport system substrate-binding protein [Paenibacillus sp. V4I3]MDQ0890709.1 putative aldouronate transport system substrate-binding protein [Paenibacillus sp. V4I9]